MEVEVPKKRVATQEEKRCFLKDQVLGDFLKGKHALTDFLGRKVLVAMDEEDKEALLDRLMKIPEEDKVMVFHTLNSLVIKSEQVELIKSENQKKETVLYTEVKQLDIVDDQKALRDCKKNPTVRVFFKHLSPPPKETGGWPYCDRSHPQLVKWYKLFDDYPEWILQGSRNANNIAEIWEHDMPLDYAIMISPLDDKPVMRFVIFEPYPEEQEGFKMYITPLK